MAITPTRKLRLIGGSLAVTIPKDVAKILKITVADSIEFYTLNGDVCIRKAKKS